MNNLDSNQRHREPPEEEKYPKKNLQTNLRPHNEGLQRRNNVLLDSISNQESQGGLAKKLNHQHEIIQQKHQLGSNVPQILFPSEAGAAGQVYQGTFKLFNDLNFALSCQYPIVEIKPYHNSYSEGLREII